MLEDLLKLSEAHEFLADYPKAKWKVCFEAVFLYGLRAIKKDYPEGVSISELVKITQKGTDRALKAVKSTELQGVNKGLDKSKKRSFLSAEREIEGKVWKTQVGGIEGDSKIREPRICSIENAKRVMNGEVENDRKWRKRLEKEYAVGFEVNIDYLPRTISKDMLKIERKFLDSPRIRH